MANQFIGEIRMFGGNFAPVDWALCNGQLMAIAQNDALFALIGTTYGGDGVQTFGLPNLQGRVPVHQGQLQGGSNYVMGELAGAESVTPNASQLPVHQHTAQVITGAGTQSSPNGQVLAASDAVAMYTAQPPNAFLNNAVVQIAGSSQPHDNMQPFLAVTFIIALYGVFPSQN